MLSTVSTVRWSGPGLADPELVRGTSGLTSIAASNSYSNSPTILLEKIGIAMNSRVLKTSNRQAPIWREYFAHFTSRCCQGAGNIVESRKSYVNPDTGAQYRRQSKNRNCKQLCPFQHPPINTPPPIFCYERFPLSTFTYFDNPINKNFMKP